MILIIYLNGINDAIVTKEISSLEEAKEKMCFFGYQRIDKVILTDFRAVEKIDKDGKKESIAPNF